jgi:hypothetical protein
MTAALVVAVGAVVTYDPARLVIGLGVAIALLVVAGWLVRTTDWHPPSEADTPELDDASLDLAQ